MEFVLQIAREDTLQQLHMEIQRRERAEHEATSQLVRAEDLQKRVNSLEHETIRMRDLMAVQRRSPSRLDVAGVTESLAVKTIDEMAIEVQVLRQQVNSYFEYRTS